MILLVKDVQHSVYGTVLFVHWIEGTDRQYWQLRFGCTRAMMATGMANNTRLTSTCLLRIAWRQRPKERAADGVYSTAGSASTEVTAGPCPQRPK